MSEMENAFKQEKQPTSKKGTLRTEKNFDRVVDLDLLT